METCETVQEKVSNWLSAQRKTIEFLHAKPTTELVLNNGEDWKNVDQRICDPYVCLDDFCGEVREVRNSDDEIVDNALGLSLIHI